jgi:predicted acetyltransferase
MEAIERKIYCQHCGEIKAHHIIRKTSVIIDNHVVVAFYKRCENTDRHIVKEKRPDGYKIDAIPAHDWNALVENKFL